MGINQFKTYALQTMCEEHLWKVGESDTFKLKDWEYKIEKTDKGYTLTTNGTTFNEFPTMGKLFHYMFDSRWISYN